MEAHHIRHHLGRSSVERRIDAIEAETDDGRRITLYFDPYWHFVRMDRKLGAPAGTSPEGR